MIPALPCGTFSDGDTPHHVGEYRIDVVIRALQALKACGYDDVEIGSIFAPDPEHVHLLLIGLDGEARFGDTQMGCIAVVPVEVA